MDNQKKQEALDNLLRELSKSQTILKDNIDKYLKLLTTIYCDDFRHMYSSFYAVLTEIDTDKKCSLDILSENISYLCEETLSSCTENSDVYKGIRKLYDHINLDISRINYIRAISEKAEDLEKELTDVAKKAKIAYEKAQKMQRESVTILGIFVSIAVVLFSSIGLTSSTLANIEKASIYRLSFMAILVGIVLFNLLVILMNFIRDIVSLHKGHKCLIVIGNIVLIALLVLLYRLWHCQILGPGML